MLRNRAHCVVAGIGYGNAARPACLAVDDILAGRGGGGDGHFIGNDDVCLRDPFADLLGAVG